LNVVGGLKINEPACDLAVACALISAAKDRPIPKDVMITGELGLSGEVRMVSQIEARIKEAEKLGFSKVIVPAGIFRIKSFKPEKYKLEIKTIKHIRDLGEMF